MVDIFDSAKTTPLVSVVSLKLIIISAVSSLTFEEIDELRVDPLGFTDLVINNETRISGNTLSTTTQDFNIQPNAGQKVKVVATTSLVLPVGNNNEKGNPEQGWSGGSNC